MSQNEQGRSKEEILDELFYKPEFKDWYKPVLKAMDIYSESQLHTATQEIERLKGEVDRLNELLDNSTQAI